MRSENCTPTIAVVIPNRNDSVYLSACFDSALQQKILPDQIVFVDDQSSDDSVQKALLALKGVSGASVITNPVCLGTMGALNEGLKHVSCDYVLFLASNDHLMDGIIEHAKTSIAANGTPGVWSAMVWAADSHGNRKYVYPSPVVALRDMYFPPEKCISMSMKLGNWFTGTTLIFHRESLQSIGGFDIDYRGLADLLAALTISSLKGAIFCPEPLGVMRIHPEGYLWGTLTDQKRLEAILEKIEERCPKLSPRLFGQKFCERMKHRIRFAAIRASDGSNQAISDHILCGNRYRILGMLSPICGSYGKLRIILAFLLLRPFDVIPMVWYRGVGSIWIKTCGYYRKPHDQPI